MAREPREFLGSRRPPERPDGEPEGDERECECRDDERVLHRLVRGWRETSWVTFVITGAVVVLLLGLGVVACEKIANRFDPF